MAKIQVLDKHVAELIAAGEVVERPSSVIKELVENSIDAGASAITVEIQNGGITFMRVTDNGCGISPEDVETAFLRHATSKVATAADLDSIGSLGFRGEALASISAVSHVELLTRTAEAELGVRLVSDGGEVREISEAGCPTGTTIVVRDLFYNVPARMKFLKKDVGEGNSVAGIMDKIALSHPEIAFRLIRDKKDVLHTPGDNQLSSAIYAVYGKEFLQTLIPVDYSLQGIQITGYISKPSGARPNRAMQNFFINGRFVKSRTAFAALEEGFKGSVTVGRFPACVLQMTMDFSTLDVNVHPAKLEVRFVNERPIFDAVYHAVKSALTAGDKPKDMPLAPKRPPVQPYQPVTAPEQIRIAAPKKPVPVYTAPVLHDSEEQLSVKKPMATRIESLLDREVVPEKKVVPMEEKKPIVPAPVSLPVIEEQEPEPYQEEVLHRFIGEAFNTYIILEYGDGLMLIDKHAAHERLLYEKLKSEQAGQEAQTLLAPLPVTLDKASYNAVIHNLEVLDRVGFCIEDFGEGTVLLRSAPLNLEGQDAAGAIIEISGYLAQNPMALSTEYMDWVYHNVACRAAIKGGRKSDSTELIALAKRLEENPEIRYCPHGRPISVRIKKYEIEKQFKRL